MGLKDINTLKLLYKPLINYSTKGAKYKGIIIIVDRSIEFF
jgi:hypothetical protein